MSGDEEAARAAEAAASELTNDASGVDSGVDEGTLRAILAALPTACIVVRADAPRFTIVAATDAYLRGTLVAREAVIGRGLFDVFPDANSDNGDRTGVANLRASLETVLRTRAPHRMAEQRFDVRRADGSWEVRHWSPTNVPVPGPDGAPRFVVHHVRDVSVELRDREALALAERRAASVLERMADAHVVLDREFRFVAVNPAAERVLGQPREALLGRTHWAAFPRSVDASIGHAYRRVAADGLPQHVTYHYTGRGHDLHLEVDAYPTPEGGVAVFWRDVTASRRATEERERALGEAERARRATARILHAASDGILGVDTRGRTTFVNPAAERLLGWRAEDLVGLPQHAMIHHTRPDGTPYPESECALFRAVRDGVAGRVEGEVFWRRDGTGFPVEYEMTPETEDGGVVGAVVTFRDVTERRQAEKERERLLAEAERARAAAEAANRAKSEFLATMSHELRTPLNAIGGYADLLDLGIHGPLTDAQRDALGRIQRSGRHLLSLINEVLNYARIEAGAVSYDVRPVSVADAVAEAETLVAPQLRAKGLGYTWAGCDPTLAACADREKLQQILLNLLSNAVKFTEPRAGHPGRVEARCDVDAGGPNGAERVLLRVSDTGIGIPAEKLASIFEPFVQVRSDLTRTHEGTGLGLAISRDLARGMGGDLTAESAPGVGSTFTLALPRALPPPRPG